MSKLLEIARIRREDVENLNKSMGDRDSGIEHYDRIYESFVGKYGKPGNLFLHIIKQMLCTEQNTLFAASEFKRASPSKGDINEDSAPDLAKKMAIEYAMGGTNLISVLTEKKHFKGSLLDMFDVREELTKKGFRQKQNQILVLRKDFIVDEIQLFEARSFGADTILLIVAILSKDELRHLLGTARQLGLEPLVEVANGDELNVALEVGAKVIGVNNRNLHDFTVDMQTSIKMAEIVKAHEKLVDHSSLAQLSQRDKDAILNDIDAMANTGVNLNQPSAWENSLKNLKDRVVILSLSGIKSREDVEMYEQSGGISGVLIGETLMKALRPSKLLRSLFHGEEERSSSTKTLVKICGITNSEAARFAAEQGADFIGMIFAPKSKRKVEEVVAKEIVKEIKKYRESTSTPQLPSFKIDFEASQMDDFLETFERDLNRSRPLLVGVFQNESPQRINELVQTVGFDLVQLHDSFVDIEKEAKIEAPVIRVVHVNSKTKSFADVDVKYGPAKFILLDTAVDGVSGGTGQTFDWNLVSEFRKKFLDANKTSDIKRLPLFLAGGLTPENVGEAVGSLAASIVAVDVASGVEIIDQPGSKDLEKVRSFIKNAQSGN